MRACGVSQDARSPGTDSPVVRWTRQVTVTDLHLRATKVLRYMNCSALSDFNLLKAHRRRLQRGDAHGCVSSAGTYTDSHSDDPDGSNHCFVGRKLWLVWDTFLGIKKGLEDVERCELPGSGGL